MLGVPPVKYTIYFSLSARTHVSQVFGASSGAKIYGILFTAFAAASISGTFLTKV